MKRAQPESILSERLGLRPPQVIKILGSEQIFHEVCQIGWLKPVVQRHKLTTVRCWSGQKSLEPNRQRRGPTRIPKELG